ncbi:hypothetical protein PTTG_26161 [Puccinia triticina 1-1 BBBD Race 1]|uniref:Uncharacterized protein n=1 Tax=Puccinia triticina (isolate 1-1 / race 1 (BBBD)) TaxID=630390 RepID=A0A180GWI4_PUCT1|nr:hypothetical protein PTTG_26161 [Puccinia triticina 1-1 BBBD Race 1]
MADQQQLSLLELLHLNFTPKPTLQPADRFVQTLLRWRCLDRLLLRPSPMKSEELSPRTSQPSGSHPQPEKPPPEKPQAEEDSLESRIQPYMAIRLVEQIKNTHPPGGFLNPFSASDPAPTAASKQPILASPHPHRPPTPAPTRPNIGLTINSSFPPQELAISTGQPNPEILYTAEPPPHVLPITLFPSAMLFAPGNRVAVDGFISYATKAGRIRVIDQNSGARMLLRKHDGPVIDMCIGRPRPAPAQAPTADSCSGKSRSGSTRTRRATRCWPRSAPSTPICSAARRRTSRSPPPARFVALSAHPLDPSIFLLSTNDHRLILVRLDRGAFAPAWKRGTPLPKALSELEAFEGQDVLRTSSDVVAFAFSPDGSAFAFVTEDKILTVRQTSKPHWTIMGGQLPASPGGISRLEFLARAGGAIKGFLITKRSGTRVEAVQLSEISEVVIGISLHPPESPAAQALPCFGHSAWQPQYSTILLSNSLRGSIFTFHLNFCDPVDDEPGLLPDLPPITTTTTTTTTTTKASRLGTSSVDDDASYIERVAASRQSPDMQRSRSNSWIAARTMFVDQISELPSPDPIISFVLDQGSRPPPGPSSSPVSVFNLHPKGIHQLYLPKDLLDFHPSKNCLPDTPAAHSAAPPVRSRSLAGEILVDVHVEHQVQKAEVLDFSHHPHQANVDKPALPSSSAPPDQPLLDSSVPDAKKTAGPAPQNHHLVDPLLALVNDSPHSENGPAMTRAEPPLLAVELEKSRAVMVDHVHALLAKSLDKQEQKLRNQFLAQQDIETRRHEHLLAILSSSLGPKNLGDIVSHHVKNALLSDTHNQLNGRPKEPADAETGRTADVVRKAVHEGLKKFLGPEPEAVVRKTQMKEIVDELGRTISAQLEQTVAEMRRTQQAEAAGREKVVAELVEERRVEASGRRDGPAVPVAAPPSSSPARGPPEAGPRPETPDYEELFTHALAAPGPAALAALLDGPAAAATLSAVFPAPPAAHAPQRSRLSQPVLLTLAHHLCQDLLPDPAAPQPAPLGVFGLARLRWTWAALAALDELDQQTAQYFDRVLDRCQAHLSARKAALVARRSLRPSAPPAADGSEHDIDALDQVLWVVHDKVLRFRAGRVPGA